MSFPYRIVVADDEPALQAIAELRRGGPSYGFPAIRLDEACHAGCRSGRQLILSVAVLLGWHVHSIPLIQVLPTLTPMQRMTSVGLLLSSVALILAATGTGAPPSFVPSSYWSKPP